MNIWDILILLLTGAAVVLAHRTWRGKRKTGGCSCGCGECARDCPMRSEENTDKTNR